MFLGFPCSARHVCVVSSGVYARSCAHSSRAVVVYCCRAANVTTFDLTTRQPSGRGHALPRTLSREYNYFESRVIAGKRRGVPDLADGSPCLIVASRALFVMTLL
uniref:Secreted protein n=1 Tax=Steinernema glaseri TaxID=37863 RepID=A0A1I7ZUH8_9BILA